MNSDSSEPWLSDL